MPGKTNTEAIRELEQFVARLDEHSDALQAEIDRLREAGTKSVELFAALDKRVTILEERLVDLKKSLEESDRKRWGVWLALIGALLAMLVNVVLLFLGKK
ncbi:MAG: hypothetical protein K2R98_01985 [Gemmataceae bacterium]|nr:hypothetical protein [Gemmataceae bacterium]